MKIIIERTQTYRLVGFDPPDLTRLIISQPLLMPAPSQGISLGSFWSEEAIRREFRKILQQMEEERGER